MLACPILSFLLTIPPLICDTVNNITGLQPSHNMFPCIINRHTWLLRKYLWHGYDSLMMPGSIWGCKVFPFQTVTWRKYYLKYLMFESTIPLMYLFDCLFTLYLPILTYYLYLITYSHLSTYLLTYLPNYLIAYLLAYLLTQLISSPIHLSNYLCMYAPICLTA